ncbi:MAG: DNA-binding protein [Candidatus Micrarchaeales archaeon]
MANEEEGAHDQKRLRKALMEQLKRQQIEQQKREVIKKLMDQAAYDRLMNIKIANNDLYTQLVDLIINLAQSNRLQGKLTEQQLLQILEKVTYRPDTKIEYKHK